MALPSSKHSFCLWGQSDRSKAQRAREPRSGLLVLTSHWPEISLMPCLAQREGEKSLTIKGERGHRSWWTNRVSAGMCPSSCQLFMCTLLPTHRTFSIGLKVQNLHKVEPSPSSLDLTSVIWWPRNYLQPHLPPKIPQETKLYDHFIVENHNKQLTFRKVKNDEPAAAASP